MPRVLISGAIHPEGMAVLKARPGLDIVEMPDSEPATFVRLLPAADALLIRTAMLPREALVRAHRLKVVSPETYRDFEALGWHAEILEVEVLDWLARQAAPAYDVMVANLFLHHFPEPQLAGLLRAAARQARVFIAVEPRRSEPNLLFSRLLWLIGCNQVTRHDAPVSVRAGFTGNELSRLWPAGEDWTLQERPAGWCSRLFIAQRRD